MVARREDLTNTLTLGGLLAARGADVVLLDAGGQPVGSAPMVETESGPLPAWHVFVANTSAPNRHGDIIEQDDWQLDNYRANPVILWMHDLRQDPLGRGEVWVARPGTPDACLMVRVWWNHKRERAREVCEQVEDGMLSAVSIRATFAQRLWRDELPETDPRYKRTGWGRVLSHGDLEEISIVTVPGDPNALKQALLAALDSPPAPEPATPTPAPEPPVHFLRTLALTLLSMPTDSDITDEDLGEALKGRIDEGDRARDAVRSTLSLDAGASLPEDLDAALLSAGRAGYIRVDQVDQMIAEARAEGAEAAESDPVRLAQKLVDEKLNAGAILPALADSYRQLAASDPAAVTSILSAKAPGSVVPLGEQRPKGEQPPAADLSGPTAEQLAAGKRAGLTEDQVRTAHQQVLEQRAARRGER